MKTTIRGIAAIARLSTNGHFYPSSELAKLDGKTVPLLWHHQGNPKDSIVIEKDKIIGEATVHWDSWMEQLTYVAEVNEEYTYLLTQYPKLGASIGVRGIQSAHKISGEMVKVIHNLTLDELSITPYPAIPETTVKLSEYLYSELSPLDASSRMKLEVARAKAVESYANISGAVKIDHKPYDNRDPYHRQLADYVRDYQAVKKARDEPPVIPNPDTNSTFKKKVKVIFR